MKLTELSRLSFSILLTCSNGCNTSSYQQQHQPLSQSSPMANIPNENLCCFLVQIWVIGEAFPMYQDEEDTGPFSPIQTEKMGANMTFLDSERINLNLNNHLPVIDHLMEAFQHWTYIEIHSKIDQSINPIYF
ncbi:hypothetical protein PSTT_03213 [Puccinia striiformis]|uniref:Uncharacterized protein n=1 Tax=Puccinia striiformis TaxID=27350 RepID=A0A2S4VX98_9BASI|nr:hypothetical protein PSTT_03213 [Puccinia striiformis]